MAYHVLYRRSGHPEGYSGFETPDVRQAEAHVRDLEGQGFSARIVEAPAGECRCGHPKHRGQCPHPLGCWCDTFTKTADS